MGWVMGLGPVHGQELSANPLGLESNANPLSEAGLAKGEVHQYTTQDGRLVRGMAVVENESFLVVEVEKDSRGEVPRGERILIFRRDIRETK